jgi:hypothetical protein
MLVVSELVVSKLVVSKLVISKFVVSKTSVSTQRKLPCPRLAVAWPPDLKQHGRPGPEPRRLLELYLPPPGFFWMIVFWMIVFWMIIFWIIMERLSGDTIALGSLTAGLHAKLGA